MYRFAIFNDIQIISSAYFGYNTTTGRDMVPVSTKVVGDSYFMALVKRNGSTSVPCFAKISNTGVIDKFSCVDTAIIEGHFSIGNFINLETFD